MPVVAPSTAAAGTEQPRRRPSTGYAAPPVDGAGVARGRRRDRHLRRRARSVGPGPATPALRRTRRATWLSVVPSRRARVRRRRAARARPTRHPGALVRQDRWQRGPAGRHQRRHLQPAAAGPGHHRRHDLRAAVPDVRQRAGPDQGAGAQRAEPDRHLRGDGVDLPGGPPGRACSDFTADRDDRHGHADPHVLHRLRAVDGLRGVPAVPHQGGARPPGAQPARWRSASSAPGGS